MPDKVTKLWAVMQVRSGEYPNYVWELQGVFSSEQKATAACHDRNFCFMPIELDIEYPIEREDAPGCKYPKA